MRLCKMFRLTLIGVALLAALLVTVGCSPAGPVAVEIAYRNHPPVRDVLVDVDSLLAKYDKQVQVTRYDVDTPEGDAFLKTKQVTDPCVLAIFIKGSMAYQQVKFFSFPVGKGTAMTAAGNWTPADLDAALALATGSKK